MSESPEKILYDALARQKQLDAQINQAMDSLFKAYTSVFTVDANERTQVQQAAVIKLSTKSIENLIKQVELAFKEDSNTINTLEESEKEDDFFKEKNDELKLTEFIRIFHLYAKQNDLENFGNRLQGDKKLVHGRLKIDLESIGHVTRVKRDSVELQLLIIRFKEMNFPIGLFLRDDQATANQTNVGIFMEMHDRAKKGKLRLKDVENLHEFEKQESYPNLDVQLQKFFEKKKLLHPEDEDVELCEISSYDPKAGTIMIDNGINLKIVDDGGEIPSMHKFFKVFRILHGESITADIYVKALTFFKQDVAEFAKIVPEKQKVTGTSGEFAIPEAVETDNKLVITPKHPELKVTLYPEKEVKNLELLELLCAMEKNAKKKLITVPHLVSLHAFYKDSDFNQADLKLESYFNSVKLKATIDDSDHEFALEDYDKEKNTIKIANTPTEITEEKMDQLVEEKAESAGKTISGKTLCEWIKNHRDTETELQDLLKKHKIIVDIDGKKFKAELEETKHVEKQEIPIPGDPDKKKKTVPAAIRLKFKGWFAPIKLSYTAEPEENLRYLKYIFPFQISLTRAKVPAQTIAWAINEYHNTDLKSELQNFLDKARKEVYVSKGLTKEVVLEHAGFKVFKEGEEEYCEIKLKDWPAPYAVHCKEPLRDNILATLERLIPLTGYMVKKFLTVSEFVGLHNIYTQQPEEIFKIYRESIIDEKTGFELSEHPPSKPTFKITGYVIPSEESAEYKVKLKPYNSESEIEIKIELGPLDQYISDYHNRIVGLTAQEFLDTVKKRFKIEEPLLTLNAKFKDVIVKDGKFEDKIADVIHYNKTVNDDLKLNEDGFYVRMEKAPAEMWMLIHPMTNDKYFIQSVRWMLRMGDFKVIGEILKKLHAYMSDIEGTNYVEHIDVNKPVELFAMLDSTSPLAPRRNKKEIIITPTFVSEFLVHMKKEKTGKIDASQDDINALRALIPILSHKFYRLISADEAKESHRLFDGNVSDK